MSQWTHVNGCIRIDGIPIIPGIPGGTKESVEKILGKQVSFEDLMESREAENIPMGSEGSIRYEIIRAGDGLVLWTVAIWGDLRNFGSPEEVEEIKAWWKRVTEENKLIIRSAVLEIAVEYQPPILLRYTKDDARVPVAPEPLDPIQRVVQEGGA